jgi:hypothetical protein
MQSRRHCWDPTTSPASQKADRIELIGTADPGRPVTITTPQETTMPDTTAPQLFSGHLRPFPGFDPSWARDQVLAANRDLAECARVLGDDVLRTHTATADPQADLQDFWEDVARMAAASRAARRAGLELAVREARNWNDDQLSRRLGPVDRAEENPHAFDPLLDHPLLAHHVGRRLARAGFFEAGELAELTERTGSAPADLIGTLEAWRDAGVQSAVVKTAPSKLNRPVAIDLPGRNYQGFMDDLIDGFGWNLDLLAGRPDAFLVSEQIPMICEYRFFVVGGRIVTGAANIEEFTPYDRDPDHVIEVGLGTGPVVLDDRVRVRRGALGGTVDPVIAFPEMVADLAQTAAGMVREHPGTYVLDLADTATPGRPVVVELNSLPNAGLFAADPDALFDALVTASDRGYRTRVPGTLAARETV